MASPISPHSAGALRRVVARLIRYRYVMLGIALVLGVGAAYLGRGLTLDRSIENMFAVDDPILVPYRRLQRTFGQHEVVLAMYADEELTTSAGLARLAATSEALGKIPGVVAVISLHDLPGATDFDAGGAGARLRDVFGGYTHNAELDAAGVMCLIERPDGDAPPRRETLRQMRAIVTKLPRGALVGEPVLIEEAFDLLERDGRRLNTWCTVLVTLTMLACFRSVRWLLLPVAVVQLTLALTNAALVLSGLELSMVSSMLGAIVTVVGVATVVHVMVHFQDHRRDGQGRRRALISTMTELAAPVTVAILTDAAGFAALMVSRVGPVHDFGLMMAIGSLMVLPACILLTPGSIWIAAPRNARTTPDDTLTLGRWLTATLVWSQRHVIPLVAAGAVLSAVAIAGSRRLTIETDFTKNFRADSSIVRAYAFVEDRFGGAGVWDLLIPAGPAPDAGEAKGEVSPPELAPPATAVLARVLALEKSLLESTPGLTKAISIADSFRAALGPLDKLGMFGRGAFFAAWRKMNADMPAFMASIYNVDPADGRPWLHVLLRAPEQLGAEEKTAMIEQVAAAAQRRFPEAEVTGYYVLLTRLIESVLDDQWKAFLVASLVVAVMVMLALRDWRLTAITFVPNVFPSLILFGVMGWLGLRVNMGAAMIAAVSIGLSVDSSVHYTMYYQRQRRLGLRLGEALHKAQHSVGRAAVFSTLALTVGFGGLVVSDFIPTIYFGVLVSLSMIGGLIGNLLLLPILIRAVDRRAYA